MGMCEELENILKENEVKEGRKDTKPHYFNAKLENLRKEEAGCKATDCSNKEETLKRFASFCSFLQIVPPLTQNNNKNSEEANESDEKENIKEVKKAIRKAKYCWNCENIGQYLCSGCRKARYCGEKCQ